MIQGFIFNENFGILKYINKDEKKIYVQDINGNIVPKFLIRDGNDEIIKYIPTSISYDDKNRIIEYVPIAQVNVDILNPIGVKFYLDKGKSNPITFTSIGMINGTNKSGILISNISYDYPLRKCSDYITYLSNYITDFNKYTSFYLTVPEYDDKTKYNYYKLSLNNESRELTSMQEIFNELGYNSNTLELPLQTIKLPS